MKAGTQRALITTARDTIRAEAWTHALTLDEFGAADLSASVGCGLETIQGIIKGWLVDRMVIETQRRCGPVRQMVKVNPAWKDEAAKAVGRTPAENMWHAARRLRTFSPTDLAAHANTETVAVSQADAAAYCRALLAAGYLRVSVKASPKSAREAIYRLARDTGPRPPREKRVRAVVDANTGETHLLGGHE